MGSARINVRKRGTHQRQGRRAKKRKKIEVKWVKPPTPSRAIDALIGEKEQNGKEKRKKQGAGPNLATLDHLVAE